MTRMLYFECSAGISGDMAVAAMLDLGADEGKLRQVLESLPIDGFDIRISRVKKSGLDACDFDVVLDEAHANHDHDMAYLHDFDYNGRVRCGHHAHHARCGHRDHHDHHAHNRECRHHHDCHEHRGPQDVAAVIDASSATPNAKMIAHRVFDIIAQAEACAHGVPLSEVHFHEVGAVDSIVDVLSFATCFDDLGISEVVVVELAEGKGTVRCQHGVLPVPVPAVVNIVKEHRIPLRMTDVDGELVTPTGAAIAAAVRTQGDLPERFVVERMGIGAGKRDYATAGIVRFMVIDG